MRPLSTRDQSKLAIKGPEMSILSCLKKGFNCLVMTRDPKYL